MWGLDRQQRLWYCVFFFVFFFLFSLIDPSKPSRSRWSCSHCKISQVLVSTAFEKITTFLTTKLVAFKWAWSRYALVLTMALSTTMNFLRSSKVCHILNGFGAGSPPLRHCISLGRGSRGRGMVFRLELFIEL